MDELIKALKKALLDGGLTEDSDSFKTILASKEFEGMKTQLEAELPTTFDEFLKLPTMQSDYDKRITQAQKTNETSLRKKYDFKEIDGKAPEESELMKKFRALEERMEAGDKKALQDGKRQSASKLLEGKKIPKSYVKFFDLDSEDSLESQLEGIEKDWDDTRQEVINANIKGGKLPTGGASTKVTEDEAREMAERIN